MLQKLRERLGDFYQKRVERRKALKSIKYEVDPVIRAHALYVYMTLEMERVTGWRPAAGNEYELMMSYMMANIVTSYPEPKMINKAFARVNTQARNIATNQPVLK